MPRLAHGLFTLCSAVSLASSLLTGCAAERGVPSPGQRGKTPGTDDSNLRLIDHWEGYIDHRVLVSLDVVTDGTTWSATMRVPALGASAKVQVACSEAFPRSRNLETTLACPHWGLCPVWAEWGEDRLWGWIDIHGETYDLELLRVPPAPRPPPAAEWLPAEPVTYTAEHISFRSGDVELVGQLTVPPGGGPFPAVAILSGGDATDRDGNAFVGQSSPFYRRIADFLTRRGFIVLRADDRGVGQSTGSRGTATLGDLSDDAVAAVKVLAARDDVRADAIGLIGYSEGAIVAPIVSVRDRMVSYVVLLAPQAVAGATARIEYRTRRTDDMVAELTRAGLPTEDVRKRLELYRSYCLAVVAGRDPATARQELLRSGMFEVTMVDEVCGHISSRELFYLRHDPAAVLGQVNVPVLAVYCGEDEIVPPAVNEPALRDAAARGGNANVTVKVFPRYGHGMRIPMPPEGYDGQAPARVPADDVLDSVVRWCDADRGKVSQ